MYKISHNDGSIVWRFGGQKNDFEFDDHFSSQHDARVRSQNETHTILSVLDNAFRPAIPETNEFSRGLLMSLNTDTMTAEVLEKYKHPLRELVDGRGSYQALPNGNVFMGFTEHAFQSEHAHNGTVLMQAKLRPNLKSYRNYKFPWVGHPTQPPDVYSVAFVAENEDTYNTNIYMSWNGATEVDTWNVYKVHPKGKNELVANTARRGFETAITYHKFASHVIVEALDREGKPLGRSTVTETIGPPAGVLDSLDRDQVEWIQNHLPEEGTTTVYRNPVIAFVAGIVFCAVAGLTGWAVWHFRSWRPARAVAWWKRRTPVYDQLLRRPDVSEEEFALDEEVEPFEMEDQTDEESEAKDKDSGSSRS